MSDMAQVRPTRGTAITHEISTHFHNILQYNILRIISLIITKVGKRHDAKWAESRCETAHFVM